MASSSEFDKPSPWLKKTDVEPPVVWTIAKVEKKIADDGRAICAISFRESDKLWDVNKTCRLILGAMAKTDDYTKWPGMAIELFNDVTVVYQGKVGGIRCRPAPRHIPASLLERVHESENDDIEWGSR
jgi:hypothetical protein